jgi:flagellar FliL protein
MTASNANAPQKPAAPPKSEATALKAKPKAAVLITVLVAAAVAGVGGGFALAPRLTPHGVATADSEPEHGTKEHGRGEKGSGGRIFKIDNLIVNPAGSEGSRFLMTSVAFEVETEAAELALKDHEVQVRDLVVSRLENQTMRMLTLPFARDSLKRQLAAAIVGVIGPKARVTVYLPQFVIQ